MTKLKRDVLIFCGLSFSLTVACASNPDGVGELKFSSLSDRGVYSVTLWPIDGEIVIGSVQSWIINVREPDGTVIYPARITVGGGMESHAHGLPTQPQVLNYGGNGDYLVEGVRFSMEGSWNLRFLIESAIGSDVVTLVIPVSYE